ncbi:CHAT domain-containing protein [Acrocarpospora macrocephala]|uniref:CHAT domain-containing protein n=1 Tax=Acrocarpospora macrocephala TaxID=150177 RepID=A0A5M3WXA9_9ACTN|nr:CHAT domain-containing protein [Acrocarpospora macrocephala]GES13584.1 CHAT domain-containing protein [Acrocarpospora macrocephala]
MSERDRLLAEVEGWLGRVAAEGDMALALHPDALAAGGALADAMGGNDPDAWLVLGWLHWYRFQALPPEEGQDDFTLAIDMFAECFVAAAGQIQLPEIVLPLLARRAAGPAAELLERAMHSADARFLSAVVMLWERIVETAAPDDSGRTYWLANLSGALATRASLTRSVQDLDRAIAVLEEAIALTPPEHEDQLGFLNNISSMRMARLNLTESDPDLNSAIATLRDVVEATPANDPDRVMYLYNLGNSLRKRFNRFGDLADLDASLQALETARSTVDPADPNRARYLAGLGDTLLARFERIGDEADLDRGILVVEEAVAATPPDHPDHTDRLAALANAAHLRHTRFGSPRDLDTALTLFQRIVGILSPGDSDWARHHANLGAVHMIRFERYGDPDDMRQGIESMRVAISATPEKGQDRAEWSSNLGAALRARFERTGELADLDEAIQVGREAIAATAEDFGERAIRMSNLAGSYAARSRRTGAPADLDLAIELEHAVLEAVPDGHFYLPMFASNLGYSLWERFIRSRSEADLEASIAACRTAVAAVPAGHPQLPMFLNNLALPLRSKAELTGTAPDIEAAVDTCRTAVEATAPEDPGRSMRLSNLANALHLRFSRTGDLADLDAAIEAGQDSLDVLPPDHPSRAERLGNLSVSLRSRFERSGAAADLDALITVLEEAASLENAAPSVRVNAARVAAQFLDDEPARAADLLEQAILLLPEMTPRRIGRGDRQRALTGLSGIAGGAASLVLAGRGPGREARALRLLEAGRAVLLSQSLATRGDLSELVDRHPALAGRFTELRDLLDASPEDGGLVRPRFGRPDDATADRHRLAQELAGLLETIRERDGFASFGLPPTVEELLAEAVHGPVVVFSVSGHRCDALLLTRDGITTLPLPGLTLDTLAEHIQIFHNALFRTSDPDATVEERLAAQGTLREILGWLWDNATGPVLDALGFHGAPAGDLWPRVWWSPGGALGLLPLHASGHHDEQGRSVLDRVVSSYTPTIGALRHARQRISRPGGPERALIVAMPTTPGLRNRGRLPHAATEAAHVAARIPGSVQLTEPHPLFDTAAPGPLPTKANVLAHLPACAIAHFACHGASDPTNPSRSLLFLHDHADDPLTIAGLAPIDLDHARLAYLSACHTAMTADTELLDEAIHLTSAFQLAGFPHVIGTQWQINDAVAAELADNFYAHLTATGVPDYSHAAHSLHHAVRALRTRFPQSPSLWGAYLHAGA